VVSEHSLKAIAVDCLTQGLLKEITTSASQGVNAANTAGVAQAATTTTTQTASTASASVVTKTLGDRLSHEMLRAAVQSGLQIAIEGADPVQALTRNFISGAVNSGTGFFAQEIGLNREALGTVGHKLAHAALGAVSGELLHGDAASGALGAFSAEFLADIINGNPEDRILELYAQAMEKGEVDHEAISAQLHKELAPQRDWLPVAGAGAALLAGGDVNAAYGAGRTAVENNNVVTVSILVIATLARASAFYDIYQIYQTEGIEAAVQELVKQGVLEVLGLGAFKLAGKVYPTAKEAWLAVVQENKILHAFIAKSTTTLDKVSAAGQKVAAKALSTPTVQKAAEKGLLGEAASHAAMKFKDYTHLNPRLPGNKGIDSIFVKRNAQGQVTDIVVVESKYASKGGKPKLAKSGKRDDKVQQLSNAWMDKQLAKMETIHPDIHKLLKQNEDKIRFKANVLDEKGINRWYDYGKYIPNDPTNKAIRTVTGGTS
jgi:hypothetical protein